MNPNLKEKYGMNKEEFEIMVKNLDNNQVKLIEDTRIYRGLKVNINNFKIGDKIPDLGYASTSFDKGVGNFHATGDGSILCIDASKGTKWVYIRQNSLKPEEVEFLLPRGSVLEVNKINKSAEIVHCKIKYK